MGERIGADELAELLVETRHRHHEAYADADGLDPEWALWYAGYLQARLWDRVGRVPLRSELVHDLVAADRAYTAAGPDEPWSAFYAHRLLAGWGG